MDGGFVVKDKLLEGSEAFSTVLGQYALLIDNGFARPNTPWNSKHRVMYISDGEKIACGIVYATDLIAGKGWFLFSFTLAEYRRQGLYTSLRATLEKKLEELGITEIGSHVHVANVVQIAVCAAVGSEPEFIRMTKTL